MSLTTTNVDQIPNRNAKTQTMPYHTKPCHIIPKHELGIMHVPKILKKYTIPCQTIPIHALPNHNMSFESRHKLLRFVSRFLKNPNIPCQKCQKKCHNILQKIAQPFKLSRFLDFFKNAPSHIGDAFILKVSIFKHLQFIGQQKNFKPCTDPN